MTYTRTSAFAAVVLAISAASPGTLFAQANNEPTIPVGWLTANPTVVQPGVYPTLTWGITYPSIVQDYVDVDDNTVTPKESLICDIRVLGAGVTVANTNGSNMQFVPTRAEVKYDNGSYTQIFYGKNTDVRPSSIVWTKTVAKDKKLRFGGKYYYNNQWGPYFTSQSGTKNVRTLVNGDVPPTTYPLHTAPTLESFIKPYLDASGKVKIGPMDVIVFMELTHTDAQITDQGYDLQDMVLLVTFRKP
ncbi:hypothetical protein [Luteolibacter luteus]|uniref:DUF4114 domain-containing protein n=1 Tax=Luteolibacter luteus TaxID=2728835 RepID=A0A858RMD6_9BACT|nr:hypothetical protein [Luteolibacter luteus]QJE97654.1 hypothetical protein HHL09_18340 [Luteolibacter luteus]